MYQESPAKFASVRHESVSLESVPLAPLSFSREASLHPFAVLRDTTLSLISNRGKQVEIPAGLASCVGTNGKFTLDAYAWDLAQTTTQTFTREVAQLRMVYIRGQRTEIINTWIFPYHGSQTPVFAAELIGVGEVTRVAFIDIQTPCNAEQLGPSVIALTQPLAELYSFLRSDEAPPDWAVDATQGCFTYARQAGSELTPAIQNCYCDYLKTYLNQFVFAQSTIENNKTRCADDSNVLHEYQLHHLESSPGKKFLMNLFGVRWTLDFLHDFLFQKL